MNKSKGFSEKFRKYFQLKNQGFGASPKIKMGVSAAKLNRSFSGVYGHRMCLLLSQISYPQIQCAPAFAKAGAHIFRKFSVSIPVFRRRNVRCKVRGNESPMPSSSKFSFRHYQVFEKKCPLYCERSVSICQTVHDPSAKKSA